MSDLFSLGRLVHPKTAIALLLRTSFYPFLKRCFLVRAILIEPDVETCKPSRVGAGAGVEKAESGLVAGWGRHVMGARFE